MVLAGNFPSNPFSIVAVPRRFSLSHDGDQRIPLPLISLTQLRDTIYKGALVEKPHPGDVRQLDRMVHFLLVGGCHTYASLVAALAMVRMHVCMFRCVVP